MYFAFGLLLVGLPWLNWQHSQQGSCWNIGIHQCLKCTPWSTSPWTALSQRAKQHCLGLFGDGGVEVNICRVLGCIIKMFHKFTPCFWAGGATKWHCRWLGAMVGLACMAWLCWGGIEHAAGNTEESSSALHNTLLKTALVMAPQEHHWVSFLLLPAALQMCTSGQGCLEWSWLLVQHISLMAAGSKKLLAPLLSIWDGEQPLLLLSGRSLWQRGENQRCCCCASPSNPPPAICPLVI